MFLRRRRQHRTEASTHVCRLLCSLQLSYELARALSYSVELVGYMVLTAGATELH